MAHNPLRYPSPLPGSGTKPLFYRLIPYLFHSKPTLLLTASGCSPRHLNHQPLPASVGWSFHISPLVLKQILHLPNYLLHTPLTPTTGGISPLVPRREVYRHTLSCTATNLCTTPLQWIISRCIAALVPTRFVKHSFHCGCHPLLIIPFYLILLSCVF